MRKIIGLSLTGLWFVFAGCPSGAQHVEGSTVVDTIHYPLSIDSGRSIIHQRSRMTNGRREIYLDTVRVSAGELYRQDSLRHPLRQFYLSYPEWETIRCIVSVDEGAYWQKAMYALLEKNGKLRIQYRGRKLHLSPVNVAKIKAGAWEGTYRKDSLEIKISAQFVPHGTKGNLTGTGQVVFRTPRLTVHEPAYLVYSRD